MADLALSKTLDPADFDLLPHELLRVDRYFASEREQHPMRRWEYAMALRALEEAPNCVGTVVDIGGAGSPFYRMVEERACEVVIVDPAFPADLPTSRSRWRSNLFSYLTCNPPLADVVTCLSVLEHVDDLDRFLYHLSCLVAPGGLLFLTVDCCACPCHDADMEVAGTPDQHHFHWMRKRMFGRWDLEHLAETLLDYQFSWLGARDFADRPPSVYDYGFASLALVKRS